MNAEQVEQFVEDGYVRIDEAFSRAVADQARAILWRDTGCDPADPATWTEPVVRLGMYSQPPFVAAANTPTLHAAFDRLVGPDRWLPCRAMGTFPIRFPSARAPEDTGWHVDMSFGYEAPDFMDWRINLASRGRALLMLFLFSDVGEQDAPTRLAVGSHRQIARALAPAGDDGLTLRQVVGTLDAMPSLTEAWATGPAGTVYLCHPFLVHAAQPNRCGAPRFMAQPPLLPARPLTAYDDSEALYPIDDARRRALDETQTVAARK